jgi:RHH-type proline utilization regulon transcriptional repressor/proline dehydrogenase/delta 1-pyrroline-5-carboxylate dehydrogenase
MSNTVTGIFHESKSTTLSQGDEIETLTQKRGSELLAALRRQRHWSPAEWFYSQLMNLTTADESLKAELFRFVDVLPSLKNSATISHHLAEYLDKPVQRLLPEASKPWNWLTHLAPTRGLVAGAAHLGTRLIAGRFIAGKDAAEVRRTIERLRRHDMAFTVDLLGEAVISETEATAFQQRYLDLIRELTVVAQRWPQNEQTDLAPFGPLPRVNISIKLTALTAHFDPMAAEATGNAVKERLRPLLRLAREFGACVYFDMEQYDYKDITQRIFREILSEPEFIDWSDVGIVVQAYLRESESDLAKLISWARSRGTPVWVRLVKGAYWDYETIIAAQRGYPVPVFSRKAETDTNYERLSELLIKNWGFIRPALATHNVRSAAHAQAVARAMHLPPRTLEFQVLYGMGAPLAHALAEQGERVRVYMPCGELIPGMAYLVRRLLENSSNESFVRHVAHDGTADSELLAVPTTKTLAHIDNSILYEVKQEFHNEPLTDFAKVQNQEKMRAALVRVRSELGELVPIVIAGQHEKSPTQQERPDPSQNMRIASRYYNATPEQAERAVEAASRAFVSWRETPVAERASLLRRVAVEFRRRRFEIAAWEVYEVGKPWREADADVAEAIDFCEFYALEMERLDCPRKRDIPGEWNDYIYEARGVTVVIAPWNFPLAILTGMTVAALVTGNPIIIKPAEQSVRVGYFLYEALLAAGAPEGVVNFLPGEGEVVGPVLVNDARTSIIAFTGSKEVGLSILQQATVIQPGQREIKRVIAELGGKNAILVDEDADLDEAVLGVVASATGYAGQKCSACSRVIVIGAAYEPFCTRLAEAFKSLRIGPADDPATTLGPVVDKTAQKRIERYFQIGNEEGELLAELQVPEPLRKYGNYVPTAVFKHCPPQGRLCQEEIFGPILAVLHATNIDEALQLADNSVYGLTGGFYSRSPHNIERVRRKFRVGNLYINRNITGALVDRQPFGGAKLSGVGSKAGGPDYLLQFLVPRTVSEEVLRRGFAPQQTASAEITEPRV